MWRTSLNSLLADQNWNPTSRERKCDGIHPMKDSVNYSIDFPVNCCVISNGLTPEFRKTEIGTQPTCKRSPCRNGSLHRETSFLTEDQPIGNGQLHLDLIQKRYQRNNGTMIVSYPIWNQTFSPVPGDFHDSQPSFMVMFEPIEVRRCIEISNQKRGNIKQS